MTAHQYRAPRVGDLLAVRSSDPHLPEVQVVIDRVADRGSSLLISGRWQECDLEVVIRRVGTTAIPHQQPPLEH